MCTHSLDSLSNGPLSHQAPVHGESIGDWRGNGIAACFSARTSMFRVTVPRLLQSQVPTAHFTFSEHDLCWPCWLIGSSSIMEHSCQPNRLKQSPIHMAAQALYMFRVSKWEFRGLGCGIGVPTIRSSGSLVPTHYRNFALNEASLAQCPRNNYLRAGCGYWRTTNECVRKKIPHARLVCFLLLAVEGGI